MYVSVFIRVCRCVYVCVQLFLGVDVSVCLFVCMCVPVCMFFVCICL